MSAVRELEPRVREKLQAAELRRQAHPERVRQRMAEIEERTQRFNQIAGPLVGGVIRPRMGILPQLFENAELLEPKSSVRDHCLCVFRHTMRFPATAKLDVGVCPDGVVESVLLTYRLEILPTYFRFDGRDQRALALDEVGREQIAAWADEKIETFIETYLRLEHADVYQSENMVKTGCAACRSIRTGQRPSWSTRGGHITSVSKNAGRGFPSNRTTMLPHPFER